TIAPRYDLLNHVLSLNIDRRWRRAAVDSLEWEKEPAGRYLDNCAGTLDLSRELARRPGFEGLVVGSDFAYPMLAGGAGKRRGARFVVLEFTAPTWQPFRAIYFFYFLHILPLIGRMISRHGSAYDYLPESVLRFPEPEELGRRMEAAGFRSVAWRRLTGGIVA